MHIVKTGLSLLTAALLATSTTLALAQTCNPNIPLTKPDNRYTYNSAGDEVTDSVTGLIWKRCAEGMSWNGGTSTCTNNGTASNFIWEGALAQAASVAQATGVAWRLPNLKELKSLVETACYDQAINQTAFPSMLTYTWSASPHAANAANAGGVNFIYGYDDWSYKGYGGYWVRLVRGQ